MNLPEQETPMDIDISTPSGTRIHHRECDRYGEFLFPVDESTAWVQFDGDLDEVMVSMCLLDPAV